VSDYRSSHLGSGRGEIYDHRFREGRTGRLWLAIERPFLTALFEQLSREHPGPFLDFAAGTGRITELAVPFFPDISGIDVSADMLREAREKLPAVKWRHGDVTREKIELGRFSVICAFRFFLRAQPELRREVLRWIHAHLLPDGVFIANLHLCSESPKGLLIRVLQRFGMHRGRMALSSRRWCRELVAMGFSVRRIFGCHFLPGNHQYACVPEPWALRIEKRLAGRPDLAPFAENQVFVCSPGVLPAA